MTSVNNWNNQLPEICLVSGFYLMSEHISFLFQANLSLTHPPLLIVVVLKYDYNFFVLLSKGGI